MKRICYAFVILIVLGLLCAVASFLQKRIPLLLISGKSEIINPWGWNNISFSKNIGISTYYFIKHENDTTVNFSFEYNTNNRYGKKGLGEYDLIKEYLQGNSIINISLTINGDTLFINARPKKTDFFSIKDGSFIKGRYYYYYKMERHRLNYDQIVYFERNKDSLISVGANEIPEFD